MGMMSPKFWHIYRREGLMRTIQRAKPYKQAHEKAGRKEVVRLVGTDDLGNRYYEDFDFEKKNTRRWVEYADNGKWHITPKNISPGWHGWMHHVYDDPPDEKFFVNPDFRPKRLYQLKLDHPTLAYKNPNHWQNPNKHEHEHFYKYKQSGYWEPTGEREYRRKRALV